MIHTVDEIFQGILAVGFIAASARLFWTARNGRRNIRLFRIVGSVITAGWGVFYVVAAITSISAAVMADFARVLQYMNLSMFLLWGFLFHEERWEEDAKRRLVEAQHVR